MAESQAIEAASEEVLQVHPPEETEGNDNLE
jgi:hypothetical protein